LFVFSPSLFFCPPPSHMIFRFLPSTSPARHQSEGKVLNLFFAVLLVSRMRVNFSGPQPHDAVALPNGINLRLVLRLRERFRLCRFFLCALRPRIVFSPSSFSHCKERKDSLRQQPRVMVLSRVPWCSVLLILFLFAP